jgi:DNA polymerase-1
MDIERRTDRLNARVQGTGADGLKLGLALLWEHREDCSGAVPIIACHDELVIECDVEQAVQAKDYWLEKAMIEGMDIIINGTYTSSVPLEAESRIAKSWAGRG